MRSKSYLLSVLIFYSATLFAQGKFYASLSAGTGYTVAIENLSNKNYHSSNNSNIGSYYINGQLGYQVHRWRLTTGLSFFRTGFHKGFAYSNDQFGFYENIVAHSGNIAIPLLLSYKQALFKNLNIVPVAGAAMVFTTGQYHYSTNDMTLNIDPWDGLGVTRKAAPAIVAKIFAELDMGKKMALFAGPSITYYKPDKQLQYRLFVFEAGVSRSF